MKKTKNKNSGGWNTTEQKQTERELAYSEMTLRQPSKF